MKDPLWEASPHERPSLGGYRTVNTPWEAIALLTHPGRLARMKTESGRLARMKDGIREAIHPGYTTLVIHPGYTTLYIRLPLLPPRVHRPLPAPDSSHRPVNITLLVRRLRVRGSSGKKRGSSPSGINLSS